MASAVIGAEQNALNCDLKSRASARTVSSNRGVVSVLSATFFISSDPYASKNVDSIPHVSWSPCRRRCSTSCTATELMKLGFGWEINLPQGKSLQTFHHLRP